jgi:GNAT superfamily N-acetyltransferase
MNDKQASWDITLYSKEDLPYILTSNQEEYGNSDLANRSYFDWLVDKNPNGPPIFVVAREMDTRRVIGWVLYAPFQILWKGDVKKVLIGFNLMVRREYRRHGISIEIIRFAVAEAKKKGYLFMAALGNAKSTSAHRKMGDPVVSTIPMVIRPLDMAAITKVLINNPLLQLLFQGGWWIAGPTIYREKHPGLKNSPIVVNEVNDIGSEFDTFCEKVKRKYDLFLARDRNFLNWRFCEMPLRSYRILTACRNDEILGYIITRIAEVRGIQCGLISDFMVIPGKEGDTAGLMLMNAANQNFREAQAQLGGGLMMPHTQEYHIMRRAGYLHGPDSIAPLSISLILRPLLDEIPIADIIRPGSWFISNADHDAV